MSVMISDVRAAAFGLVSLAAMSGTLWAVPSISATKTDSVPATTRKLPGESVTYTNDIANGAGATEALEVTFTDPPVGKTTLQSASLTATAVANHDTYPATVLPNIGIDTATSTQYSVISNDFGGYTAGTAISTSSLTLICPTTTSKGGTVNMTLSGANIGKFSYVPKRGFVGTDTFTYEISAINGVTGTLANRTGTVTITVSGPVIWFVNSTGAAGDGRQGTPFNSLAAFQTANDGVAEGNGSRPKAGDFIFLYENATAYTGPVTLLAGQKLIGQDATASLAAITGGTPPGDSPSFPIMNSANGVITKITNASGNAVNVNTTSPDNLIRGLTIGNTSGTGVAGSNFGTLTMSDVSFSDTSTRTGQALSLTNGTFNATIGTLTSSNTATGVSLTTIGGTLTINGGALSALTGTDFYVSGGNATIDCSATISNAAAGGRSIEVLNRTGGTITFKSAISDLGSGIFLDNNDQSGGTGTVVFTGGLALSTGTNAAFTATNGGAVKVTQPAGIVNTIATTSGTALSIRNTTIDTGVTFRSIASNGSSNNAGIILDNTGSSGGLTVTGTGATGTGGTIANKTGNNINTSSGSAIAITGTDGVGIFLRNTSNVSLSWMSLSNFSNYGILGQTVSNISFVDSSVTGVNGSDVAADEASVAFYQLTGTNTFNRTTINGGVEDNLRVANTSGTLTSLSLVGSTIGANHATTGNNGVSIINDGTAAMTVTVDNTTFQSVRASGFLALQQGTGAGALTATVINSRFNDGNIGVDLLHANNSNFTFTVSGNTFLRNDSNTINFSSGSTTTNAASIHGTIANNVIGDGSPDSGSRDAYGIGIDAIGDANMVLAVTNNNIKNTDFEGIFIESAFDNDGDAQHSTLNLTLRDNTVGKPDDNSAFPFGFTYGIRVEARHESELNLDMANNSALSVGGAEHIRLRQRNTAIFGLERLTGSAGTTVTNMATVESFIIAQNVAGTTADATNQTAGVTGFKVLSNGTVPDPLLLAEGGVEAEARVSEEQIAVVAAPVEIAPAHEEAAAPVLLAPQARVMEPLALTDASLRSTVEAGIQRWVNAGATSEQVALLRGLKFEVVDLGGTRLGEAAGSLIRFDRNAGGNGWFIDPASSDDVEFPNQTSSTRFYAEATGQPAGRLDLLTAVLHEMGHTLGLEDSYATGDRDSLMYGFLTKGERRLPVYGQAQGAIPHAHEGSHFLSAPISVGTLSPGKSVTITYTVTIDSDIYQNQISSQGTVSGSNFSPEVVTDDPDVVGSANATVTLIGVPPVITNAATSTTFQTGVNGSFTFTATGIPTPTFTTVSALPTGVTLSSAGVLSGTPAAGTGGVYNLVVKASNTIGTDATQNFTLTVNQPPAITSAGSTSFTTGTPGTFTVTATGYPTAGAITLSQTGTLPSGVIFVDNDNGTATLAGTPAAGTGGTYPITITANNGVGGDITQTFTLTINQAPAITSGNAVTFTTGSAGTFSVTTTGFPSNASMVIAKTGTLPTGVTLVNNNDGTATLAGTPAAGTGGTYPITITANNGIGTQASQSFTLTVNQAPAITSANSVAFATGTAGSFTVTTSGVPGNAALSVTGALPSGVTFVDNGNGTATLAGTPAANAGGSYPLTITANNTISPNATQSFTLTVNQAPAITSGDVATFTTGTAGTFTVTTTGFPSNATMAIAKTGSLPNGVTLVNNNNGTATLAGTPAAGTGGTYPITITANNGIGTQASQSFTLTVNEAPVFTSASSATFTTNSAGTFAVTTTGFPASADLSYTGDLPSGVTFVDNDNGTATLAGTPAAGTGGSYPITITASNGIGSPVNQSFTLTVNQAPAITSANAVAFTENIAGTFTVTTSGFPTGGSMAIATTGTLPSGVTFVNNNDGTATLAGTPGLGSAGSFPLTITASNGVGTDATQSFTLTVKPPVNNFLVESPSSTVAGVAFNVKVTARDDANQAVTGYAGPVTLLSSDAQAVLPVSVTFTNGVANIPVTLKTKAVAQTVTITDAQAGVSGVATVEVTVAADAKLAFVQQPTNATSQQAIAPSVSVRVLDEFNNETSSTASVTLSIGNNPNSGTLAGTKTVAAVNGVATFPGISIEKAGTSYTLQALSGSLTGVTSETFNVVPGAPAKLAFSLQPANAVSNVAIGPMTPPTVDVQDAAGNKVTGSGVSVTLAIANNPNSGTLAGTKTQLSASGEAKFPSLSINKAGTGYTFTATAPDLTSVTSDPFNILPGAASQLAIVQPPTNAVAGAAITPAVSVELLDEAGNRSTSTANVTFAIGTNPGTGTLSGTTTVAAVNGLATFSDLSLNKVGTGYTLAATSSGLTGATTTGFDISVGQPSKLAFVQSPTNAVAGESIAPGVTVRILDANDNPTTSTADVTVAIGTNPGSGTLSGTATVTAVNGVASFTGLSVNKIGAGYILAASSNGLTGANSGEFNITPATAAKLAFNQNPSNAVAGVAIAPAVTVRVLDQFDNQTASTANVTVAIGTNPGSGTLSGTTTVAAVDGVATFSGLSINKIGTGYTFGATSASLTAATSNGFDITPATAAKLAFGQQPEDAVAGAAIAPAVAVRVLDQFDNQTASTTSVSLMIATNAGGGTLSGTTSVTAVNGVATFSDLSIDKIGSGYTFTALTMGLSPTTSNGFDITPAAASQLVFGQNPSSAVAGVGINPGVTVRLLDQYSNQTSSTANVTIALGTNPGSGTLSGTATVAAVNGVATFPALSVNKIGTGYTLAASSNGVMGANSGEFNITAAAPAKLAFGQNPSNAVAGVGISPVMTVRVLDQFDNQTASTADVTVAIGTNPGSGTLSGTATVAAVNGVASFSGLSINKVGTGYALAASSTGLSGATSGNFNISAAAASQLAVVAPANAVAGTAFNVNVTALDPFGNTATGYTGTVHFTTSDASGILPADGLLTSGAGTFSVTLNSGGSHTVTGTDTVTSSITGTSDSITVSPRADLAITNSGNATAIAGQTVTYNVHVANNGPSSASSVVMSNTLPANTTFVSLSTSAGWSATTPAVGGTGTVTINKGSMASSEMADFTLTVRVASSVANSSVISDTAVISSATMDSNPGNNSGTATTTVSTSADLTVVMTDSPDPVIAGTNLTYSLTLSNIGPSDAQNVSVTDTLPAGVTFVSATSSQAGWSANTPAVGGTGTITFSNATLANADAAVFTIVARVNSSVAAGTVLSNTATAATTTSDPSLGNNASTTTTTVARSADLAVSASGLPAPEVNATTNLTYTVTLANNGPSDAANPALSYTIPDDATFVSLSTSAGWTATTPGVGATGVINCNALSLAEGENASFTIVVNIKATAANNSILTSAFTATTATTDPNAGNNVSTVSTTVKSGADLAITMVADPEPVVAGTDVTYTINLVNNGPLDANNAAITDILPVGTTFVSATASAGWTLDTPAVGSNGTITATRSLLGNGGTASLTVVAHVESNVLAGTVLANTVTTSSDTLDVFPVSNVATANTTVTAQADLALVMTGTPNPAVAESNVTFELNLTNEGPSDAADAVVSNTLPSTMTFVSATASGGWAATTPAVGSGGTVSFSKTSFENNGSASFTIVAKIKAGTANGTVIDNTATASSASTDPAVGNNVSTATTAVGTVDPTVVQTSTTATLNGQTGLYELLVDITNTTPLPINGFRLHVDYNAYKGTHPTLRLYNASSPGNSPDAYVDYPYPLAIDGKVTLKLLFYTNNRKFPSPFQPVLTVESLPSSQVPHSNGNGVQPKIVVLGNGNVLLEFPSEVGHWYRVSYSPDLTHWYDSSVPVQAGGTKTQWIDSGAPFTQSPPPPSGRYYRVNEISAP